MAGHDFLQLEMLARVAERLDDLGKTYSRGLCLGAHHPKAASILRHHGGVEKLIETDLSYPLLCHEGESQHDKIVCDEEALPFAPASFDLVISCGALQWVNDLPGSLIQIQHILKPGGLLIAMLPGGQTLSELRAAFEQAEMTQQDGISPRISPFIDVKDAGSLLQRAGFAEPVTDSELLSISYAHPLKLLKELRGMGQTNALLQRITRFTPCSVVMGMADYYLQHYSDDQGRIPASFELVTMTAWKS